MGSIYLVGGRRVTAFDSIEGLSGKPRWVSDSELGDLSSNPVLTADGALILGARDGICCLDITNRHVMWTWDYEAIPYRAEHLALNPDSTLYGYQRLSGVLALRDSNED